MTWRQEDEKLGVVAGSVMSLSPASVTSDLDPKHKIKTGMLVYMLQNQEIETWGRKKETERGKYLGNTTNKFYKTETQGSYSDNNSQAQTPSPEKVPAHTHSSSLSEY